MKKHFKDELICPILPLTLSHWLVGLTFYWSRPQDFSWRNYFAEVFTSPQCQDSRKPGKMGQIIDQKCGDTVKKQHLNALFTQVKNSFCQMIADVLFKKKNTRTYSSTCLWKKKVIRSQRGTQRPSRNYIKVSQKKECVVGACAVNYRLSEYMK